MITLTRESDVASRYSEDEFTVITPQTSLDNAVVVAERIRSKVLAYDFAIGHPLSVSISIAKHYLSEDNELLLKRGERILLEAKKTGNKILKADSKSNESKNRIT